MELYNAESNFNITENDKVVLLVGNTKSGVSTVVKILSTDNKRLVTEENEDGIVAIADEEGYIGQSMFSNTIFPHVIIANGVKYVDLPGINAEYSDPSVPGNDLTNVATSIAIQRLFSQSRYVKIVIVLDSELLSSFSPYGLLIDYFVNVKKIVGNTEPFQDGMLGLVNMVGSRLSPDDQISRFTNVLNLVSNYTNGCSNLESDDKAFIRNITNILQNKINPLMRVETVNIVLDSYLDLQSEKQAILKNLDSMSIVNKKSRKILYPISTATKSMLKADGVEYINKNVSQLVSDFGSYVKVSYDKKIDQIKDVELFINNTKSEVDVLRKLRTEVTECDSLFNFVVRIKRVADMLDISIPQSVYDSLYELHELSEMINILTGTVVQLDATQWVTAVEFMTSEAEDVLLWYNFLYDFYDQLSGYKVQTDRPEMEKEIDETNFNQFLRESIPYVFGVDSNYDSLVDTAPDDVMIDDLNCLIQRSLLANVSTFSENDTLHIFRDSITLTEVQDIIDTENYTVYNIMALKSVIKDTTLTVLPEQNVCILTQKLVSSTSSSNVSGELSGVIMAKNETLHVFLKSVSFYKEYLTNATNDKFVNTNARNILEIIDKPGNVEIYKVIDYFDEYKDLKKRFSQENDREESLYFYQIYEQKILDNMNTIIDDDDGNRTAVAQLLTSVKTRIASVLKPEGGLVIDIEKYLQLALNTVYDLKTNIDEQNDENIKDQQTALRDEFKTQIEQKMSQSIELFNTSLLLNLEEKYLEISDRVVALVDEAKALVEQGEQVQEELEATKECLEKTLKLQSVVGVILFAVKTALQYVGVSEPIINTNIQKLSIPQDIVLGDGSQFPGISVPDELFTLSDLIYENWLKRRHLTADFLTLTYEELSTYLDPNDALLTMIAGVADAIYNNETEESVQDMLTPITTKINSMIQSSKNVSSNEILSRSLANVAISGMPELVLTLSQNNSDRVYSKDDIDVVNNVVLKSLNEVQSLHLYVGQIEYIFISMFTNMKTNLEDLFNHLNTSRTGAWLEVAEWGVQHAFKQLPEVMSSFTQGFKIQNELDRELEGVNDVIMMIINIFGRVENWQNQEDLAGYLANIISSNSDGDEIDDSNLLLAVTEAKSDMKRNMIMTHYTKAVNVFKQWVLPFAEPYMYDLNFNMTEDTEELFTEVERRMLNLQVHFKDYYSRTDDYGNYITIGQFDSNSKVSQPFMTWSDQFVNSITDLLDGKEIMLSSVVGIDDFHSKNAIKFNLIKLNIKLKEENTTLAAELQDLLEYFDVELTHLGNNYYMFDGKTYFVSNENLLMSYSFETDDFGQPYRYNSAYEKVLKGDLMLSPFSAWKFRLLSNEFNRKKNGKDLPTFSDLDRFKSLVNLELIGHGSYIQEVNGKLPDLRMDDYYIQI